MNTSKDVLPKGTAISLLPHSMNILKREGSVVVAVAHTLKHYREATQLTSPPEGISRFHSSFYAIALATTDGEALSKLLMDFYLSNGYLLGKHFDIDIQASRMKTKSRNQQYPKTVHLTIRLGLPFNLKNLLADSGLDVYMSSVYNNGAYPTINGWLEIPENYKSVRQEIIRSMLKGQKELTHSKREILRNYDMSMLNRLRVLGQPINFQYNFNFHPDHKVVDQIHPDFSLRLYGNQLLKKEDPFYGKCTATVLDCLTVTEAEPDLPSLVGLSRSGYTDNSQHLFLPRCFGRIAKGSSPYAFTKSPLSEWFLGYRCSSEKDIRSNSGAKDIFKSLLIQVIELKFEQD